MAKISAAPRLSLHEADWPAADHAAWQHATTAVVNPFLSQLPHRSGMREPRPATIRARAQALAGFMSFVQRHTGAIGTSILPHATPAMLDAWVLEQQRRGNRPTTIGKRASNLHVALSMIAPTGDFGFIARPGGRPLSRIFSRKPRPVETVDSGEIIDRVKMLHAAALAGRCRYAKGHVALRDAALLGLFASRAPRLGEVVVMDLGRHLVQRAGRWAMHVEAEGNKNARDRALDLAGWLQPILDDYIHIARPALGGNATAALWLSTQRRRCATNTLTGVVMRHVAVWFGQVHASHWFRKCLTTTVANAQPGLLPDVAALLDHGPDVALGHYNLARALSAGQRHNTRIDRHIQDARARGSELLAAQRPHRRCVSPNDAAAAPTLLLETGK